MPKNIRSNTAFQCRMSVENNRLILSITDTVGDKSSKPADIDQALRKAGDVTVRINSMGGDFYSALSIYNSLSNHRGGEVVTINTGLAFSAASLILMAGSPVKSYANADTGIHRAWTRTSGNQNEMRSILQWLEKCDSTLTSVYSEKTGRPESQIVEWLEGSSDGTLFSSAEALSYGFVDEIVSAPKRRTRSAARKPSKPGPLSVAAAARKPAKQMSGDEAAWRAYRWLEKQRVRN